MTGNDSARPGADDRNPRRRWVRHLLDTIDLAGLPPPPATATEWCSRAVALCEGLPGVRDGLGDVPVGWFSAVEHAAGLCRQHLKIGDCLDTTQMKEKYGTLRWYAHVSTGPETWSYDDLALAPTIWAEVVSRRLCAVFGTPDGELDHSAGWLLTLSPRARLTRRDAVERRGQWSDICAPMYPAWNCTS